MYLPALFSEFDKNSYDSHRPQVTLTFLAIAWQVLSNLRPLIEIVLTTKQKRSVSRPFTT